MLKFGQRAPISHLFQKTLKINIVQDKKRNQTAGQNRCVIPYKKQFILCHSALPH